MHQNHIELIRECVETQNKIEAMQTKINFAFVVITDETDRELLRQTQIDLDAQREALELQMIQFQLSN